MSDRGATDYSLETIERDIDAVVNVVTGGESPRTAGERVALVAAVTAGTSAIAYTARHPERVSHLVLWCSSARTLEGIGPQLETLLDLVERDWDLVTETAAHVLRGWSASETAHRLAGLLRAAASPGAVRSLARFARATDVTDLLPRIQAETLVLHRRGVTWLPVDRAYALASSIPDARLVLLEGASMAPWAGDMAAVTRVIDEFLGAETRGEAVVDSVGNAFRREGEYWTLFFDGRFCRLHDAKGLHHIAYLLQNAGEHVPAVELLTALEPGPLPGAERASLAQTEQTGRSDLGDAGPVLDAAARRTYRRRIAALREEHAEAERFADVARASAVRRELALIEHELASATGLGGRERRACSTAERARLTVTKRIKDVLARIRSHHPALGDHLDRTIRTGLLCAYLPDRDRSVSWAL
jgi:pimeloyl-ACP methyl ester carboxylesterase